MVLVLDPDREVRRDQLRVRNTSGQPVAVAVGLRDRVTGAPVEPADISLFPFQARIDPFGEQYFRVEWLGARPVESRSYYLTVEQLPVRMAAETEDVSGMQLLVNFNAELHIVAPGGEADLRLGTWDEEGLTIENRGRRFAYVGDYDVIDPDGTVVVEGDAIRAALGGDSFVAPGTTVRVPLNRLSDIRMDDLRLRPGEEAGQP